jgi:diketogulonate reductase-like aldo/keto reductase
VFSPARRVAIANVTSSLPFFELQAWAPLVRGLRFKHPSIVSLAERYNKSAAQVLLRYSVQKVCVSFFTVAQPRACGVWETTEVAKVSAAA